VLKEAIKRHCAQFFLKQSIFVDERLDFQMTPVQVRIHITSVKRQNMLTADSLQVWHSI